MSETVTMPEQEQKSTTTMAKYEICYDAGMLRWYVRKDGNPLLSVRFSDVRYFVSRNGARKAIARDRGGYLV